MCLLVFVLHHILCVVSVQSKAGDLITFMSLGYIELVQSVVFLLLSPIVLLQLAGILHIICCKEMSFEKFIGFQTFTHLVIRNDM